jgi:oligopeptide/dipeptide ABC transporter ATP-binding protein
MNRDGQANGQANGQADGQADGQATVLDIRDLRVSYPATGRSVLRAVDGVSLSVPVAGAVGLVGESGCGKTTVARSIVGLTRPSSGQILLDGNVLGPRRSRAQQRAVQMVFQDPYSSLNPRLTVRRVLTELLAVHGLATGPAAARRCAELVEQVGLPADALDRLPVSFSGGQRQRVAIARALAVEPRLLVADEPVSALDVSVQAVILATFSQLRERLGLGLLLISHNLAVVRQVCEQVAVMYLGRIVEIAGRDEIFGSPRHPYTRALLAAAPRLHGPPAPVPIRLEVPADASRPRGCAFHPRCPLATDLCRTEEPQLVQVTGPQGHLAACHYRDQAVALGHQPAAGPGPA